MQTKTVVAEETVLEPLPKITSTPVLTLKLRLMGWDKAQFEALRDFYGVSEKKLAIAAVRHFLNAAKERLPKVEAL